jgi:hypothetical protein
MAKTQHGDGFFASLDQSAYETLAKCFCWCAIECGYSSKDMEADLRPQIERQIDDLAEELVGLHMNNAIGCNLTFAIKNGSCTSNLQLPSRPVADGVLNEKNIALALMDSCHQVVRTTVDETASWYRSHLG